MTVRSEVAWLRRELAKLGTPERAAGQKTYLKSNFEFLGASVPSQRKVTAAWLKRHPELDHDGLVAVVEALWETSVFELRSVGVFLLDKRVALLGRKDLVLVERLVRDSGTWALVDWLAIHVARAILARENDVRTLSRWAKDPDFWVRRMAILAPLYAMRAGTSDWALWTKHADAMLEEKEFFIRKAIGWVLREVAKRNPQRVVAFVEPRRARMSGLTWREATRALPVDLKRALGPQRPVA